MGIAGTLFKKRTTAPDGYAWIGLDFGTATTECVVRIEVPGEPDKIAVLAFGGDSRLNAKIILPTAMELFDSTLLSSYQLTGQGQLIELIKTRLICEIDQNLDATVLRRQDGPFAWAVQHLASVLSVARSAIAHWMGSARLHYYLNIAAPIGADPDNPRDAKIGEVFREVAYRALCVSSEWPAQPPTLKEAHALFEKGMSIRVPPPNVSPVIAVPEALAAVTSFLHAPNRKAGNYATIDVGGGTTDISFFWFQTGQYDAAHEKKAWYYSVCSKPVGTNDLLAELEASADAPIGLTSHERLWSIWEDEVAVEPENRDGLLFGVDATYREAFREAFVLRPIHKDWCTDNKARWDLLLLGGGCGFHFVQEHIRSTPPNNSNIAAHRSVTVMGAPRHLDVLLPEGQILTQTAVGGWRSPNDVLELSGHLATVAYGLSFRAPDIPKFGQEAPVEPPPPPMPWQPLAHTEHN